MRLALAFVHRPASRLRYKGGVGRWLGMIIGAAWLAAGPSVAAQTLVAPPPAVAPVETLDAAIAQDAAAVADRLGLPVAEAERQVRLQVASAPVTDAIADEFAARLTGIALVHRPDFAIVVTLTGTAAEPERIVDLDGTPVRISFRTGAAATHTGLVQAIGAYQATIRASLLSPPGLGIDQRSGELVAVVSMRDVAREGAEPLAARLAALTQVPVRLRVVDQPALDMGGIQGGTRVVGQVPGDNHRYLCTAGFVVTDGARTGIATAAHCPDALRARDAAGVEQDLPFVGQWGWGHQDVQINASAVPLAPLFYADSARTVSRPVSDARSRAGTRAGDVVCHRGERTGYSCSEVELTDFAPAGDLCGGACLPTWTTVAGPVCKSGDSGSPVFLGDTAYGILKGGSYRADGSCAFYFYMSTDFLPSGWRLLTAPSSPE